MDRCELLSLHSTIMDEAYELMEKKNHDYAGKGDDDVFANFEAVEKLGICCTEKGILIRMLDKFQRLNTFIEAGELKVLGESVKDSCIDIVNYAILLWAVIVDKQKYLDGKKTLPGIKLIETTEEGVL